MSKEIERKIHFFYMRAYELKVGSNEMNRHSDPADIITQISGLPFAGAATQSRFRRLQSGDVNFIELANNQGPGIIRGKFALSRRSALPELEQQGVLTQLNIPPNSGLAELTHFVYYPTTDVLGVEFNFYGPRTSALRDYLRIKSRNFKNPIEYIDTTPILNQDIDSLLRDMGEVNIFQMEVARNELNIVEELNNDLQSAFKAAANLSDAESVEVVLRKRKYAREGFPFPFSVRKLKEFLSSTDNRERVNKFKVNAASVREERNKNFDLLEDKMVAAKKVATIDSRRRSVDSDSMFNAIEEAYDELSDNFIRRR